MTTIWIVQGSTREYSDREEWVVEAQKTEEAAKARVARLGALMRELGGGDYYARRAAVEKAMREHPEGDPNFGSDYTGTRYWYVDCQLHE